MPPSSPTSATAAEPPTRALRDRVCVVGVGETEYSKDSGVSDLALQLRAVLLACEDAGVAPRELDGVVALTPGTSAEHFIDRLGLPDVTYCGRPEIGGAAPVGCLAEVVAALDAGICGCVVVVAGRNQRSGARIGSGGATLGAKFQQVVEFEMPSGSLLPAQWYARMARRHMHEHGTSEEHFAAVAVTTRYHASLNPRAMMRTPITVADHHASPWVVEPFRRLDCSLETDGAAAVVLMRAGDAAGRRHPAVHVMGAAHGHPDSPLSVTQRDDLTALGIAKAAPRCFAMAGVGPEDVDVAEIYDCFTYVVIKQLEDIGFVEPGCGGPFVASGATRLGGRLPVNTHGGLLSQGHIQGMNHLCEAVRQLRGEAGDAQVRDAEVAAVSGYGDLGDGALAVLRR